jgi:hypothetical protein
MSAESTETASSLTAVVRKSEKEDEETESIGRNEEYTKCEKKRPAWIR